jgi:hypothetical protein
VIQMLILMMTGSIQNERCSRIAEYIVLSHFFLLFQHFKWFSHVYTTVYIFQINNSLYIVWVLQKKWRETIKNSWNCTVSTFGLVLPVTHDVIWLCDSQGLFNPIFMAQVLLGRHGALAQWS